MAIELPLDMETVKGFLALDEGETLYRYALEASRFGPCLEIGSYCGKSTVYLGTACRDTGAVLYALDHHRGSEEHQPGEEYHDSELYDSDQGQFDSFREFRRTLKRTQLEDCVVPIVTSSSVAAQSWATPLAMVFIDGGHSLEAVLSDYRSWAGHVIPGGILAIHDIFPDPTQGGQAPYEIWKMALASGLFEKVEVVNTLGILRRIKPS
ncbi:MAG: class I SAM-dependent methyltransferase [Proteobacteria bacterium]|nr:class I SAM-dependent methyltransferase [Pseudomonadota bacterium]